MFGPFTTLCMKGLTYSRKSTRYEISAKEINAVDKLCL